MICQDNNLHNLVTIFVEDCDAPYGAGLTACVLGKRANRNATMIGTAEVFCLFIARVSTVPASLARKTADATLLFWGAQAASL
jgi:hypothetical protein